jgi:hypothetical protein
MPDLLTRVPELVRPVHPLKDWLALRQLEKILREQKPDIVHTHSGKAGILGRLAARRAGVPVIIHHIHGPSFGPFQGSRWPTGFLPPPNVTPPASPRISSVRPGHDAALPRRRHRTPGNVHAHFQRLPWNRF